MLISYFCEYLLTDNTCNFIKLIIFIHSFTSALLAFHKEQNLILLNIMF
jgi:hypothetical protein